MEVVWLDCTPSWGVNDTERLDLENHPTVEGDEVSLQMDLSVSDKWGLQQDQWYAVEKIILVCIYVNNVHRLGIRAGGSILF